MEYGQVYYDAGSQWALNLVLASMILSIALDIHWRDFKAVAKMPKAIFAGLIAQFLILPAVTAGFTLILDLPAGIELGMILVAACPGGALSNFITHLSGGNAALSISMTAISSGLALFMMPINFMVWAEINPNTSQLLQAIQVDGFSLFVSLFWVLAIPLGLGLFVKAQFESIAYKLHQLLRVTSLLSLFVFIFIAVSNNLSAFLSNFLLLFLVVLLHNSTALILGFCAGKLSSLGISDIKATTIEVGMQNSSLAIAIVFTQFNGEPGMALISAFWGTWHIVSGLMIATGFRFWVGPNQEKLNQEKPVGLDA
ncbi:MAG: bile acid:sodium symporter family protein [Kangiellaceae bacterium]